MEDDDDDNKVKEVQIQEEQGVLALPDWVEMVQNLDVGFPPGQQNCDVTTVPL